MRKILFLIILIIPTASLAMTEKWETPPIDLYSRSPAGVNITSPLSLSVNLSSDIYAEELGCNNPNDQFWTVAAYNINTEEYTLSDFVASTTTSNTFSLPLSTGEYSNIVVYCDVSGAAYDLEDRSSESDPPITISDSSSVLSVPISMISSLTANVSDTLSDAGFLTIIIFSMAIISLWYILDNIKKIVPKDKKEKSITEKADDLKDYFNEESNFLRGFGEIGRKGRKK